MTTEPERQKPRQLLLLFFLSFAALPLSSSLAFGAIERRDSHVEGDLNWRICLLHVYRYFTGSKYFTGTLVL